MLGGVHERDDWEAGVTARGGPEELVRLVTQKMLGVTLEAERRTYLERHTDALTMTVVGWLSATAAARRARSRRQGARSRSGRLGSSTASWGVLERSLSTERLAGRAAATIRFLTSAWSGTLACRVSDPGSTSTASALAQSSRSRRWSSLCRRSRESRGRARASG